MRNSCEFEFIFDRPDQIYEAGAAVSGTVILLPKKTLRCNGLTLELRWRTHGRGNRTSGKTIPVDVAFNEVQLEEGQRYEATFSFTAPPGPLTYRGHYLNIDWYLRAKLDAPLIPGFLDPQGETELLLLPKDGADIVLGPRYTPPKDPKNAVGVNWGWLFFGGAFFVPGTLLSVTAVLRGELFFLFMPLVFALVGAALVFFGVRNALAGSRLGNIQVTIDRRRLMPGDTVKPGLEFRPRRALQLDKVTATLRAREVVVRGSGSNRKTYRHTVFEEGKTLRGAGQLASEQVQLSADLVLPPDAPYTFVASDNKLVWELDILIDTKGILDWRRQYQLDVVPWLEDDYIR